VIVAGAIRAMPPGDQRRVTSKQPFSTIAGQVAWAWSLLSPCACAAPGGMPPSCRLTRGIPDMIGEMHDMAASRAGQQDGLE
jgi:hypothetical protein